MRIPAHGKSWQDEKIRHFLGGGAKKERKGGGTTSTMLLYHLIKHNQCPMRLFIQARVEKAVRVDDGAAKFIGLPLVKKEMEPVGVSETVKALIVYVPQQRNHRW